ncbi:hypothetical protein AXF42_Ash013999 [Apostasia shenzhenica]|uniref:DDE Tnp4 domain-containing protein n=1 Tax=Apostasia shenzhenica TaxID=1088818 RepID=A0A2I0A948_9ASPA|nr:hypothetical protein AXF42_Ash013999 [Apostasia shenzhenica]
MHASLRNVVERTFDILKIRFKILRDMLPYPFDAQVKMVVACCALHNILTDVLKVNNDVELEEVDNFLEGVIDLLADCIDDESKSDQLVDNEIEGKRLRFDMTQSLWSHYVGKFQ